MVKSFWQEEVILQDKSSQRCSSVNLVVPKQSYDGVFVDEQKEGIIWKTANTNPPKNNIGNNSTRYLHQGRKQSSSFGLGTLKFCFSLLARSNFRDVVMLAHVCQVLVKVLDPIPVWFIRYPGQPVHIQFLSLLYVSSLSWREMIIIWSSIFFSTRFVGIIWIFLVGISW